jgi:hypothetical protein
MATGRIQLRVVNGRRETFDKQARLLVTARDGMQKTAVRQLVDGSAAIALPGLEVRGNFADRYTVLVSTKDHADGGFTPVTIRAGATETLDLMLVPRKLDFQFDRFANLDPDLVSFFDGDGGGGKVLYDRLSTDAQPGLACLLNITTALAQLTLAAFDDLDSNPLKSFVKLDRDPSQDRIFAWADARLLPQIEKTVEAKGAGGASRMETAPAGLHKGASRSFKQTDFGEANVQLSFHETDPEPRSINGKTCFLVDVDIDYFQDTTAHLLGEVFPNKLKSLIFGKHSSKSLTDPRTVYGLRWTAGMRLERPFTPPYVIA